MSLLPEGFPPIKDRNMVGTPLINPISWGGNPERSQTHHRSHIQASGKAPIVFVHGNSGTSGKAGSVDDKWGWLTVASVLKSEYGYTDEHLWALSYQGVGGDANREQTFAATANIYEIRAFIDAVRDYCGVLCVDIVAHSMGCLEILCYLKGLKGQPDDIVWTEGEKYSGVGSVVLIDGGMRGLKAVGWMAPTSEWHPDHDVYDCLVPDHTPYGNGDSQTGDNPHNIAYWCCMLPLGYVDGMDLCQGITGHLNGADVNKVYNKLTGDPLDNHNWVKDSPSVIADWAPYLNRVAPTPATGVSAEPSTGNFTGQATITFHCDPPETPVQVKAENLRTTILMGSVVETAAETIEVTKCDGDNMILSGPGLWRVTLEAEDAATVTAHYAIDAPEVHIRTDSSTPFHGSLSVIAESSHGQLYFNVDGPDESGWVQGNMVTIEECSVVKFLAIDADGVPSLVVGANFHKADPPESATDTAVNHYLAGRIDNQEMIQYGNEFGWQATFPLYNIDGEWTLDPVHIHPDTAPPEVSCVPESGTYDEPIDVRLEASDAQDAAPRIYYTTDGSEPSVEDLYFVNEGTIRIRTGGTTTLKFFALDRSGNKTSVETQVFTMNIEDERPSIQADTPSGKYSHVVSVTITAKDDVDEHVTVHYTTDGTTPDSSSQSFQDQIHFEFAEDGPHAIMCYAKDSKGHEIYEVFAYTIDDHEPPEPGVSPGVAETAMSG